MEQTKRSTDFGKTKKFIFGFRWNGNDKFCMSSEGEDEYVAYSTNEIDAYNQLISYCLIRQYSFFEVQYLKFEN